MTWDGTVKTGPDSHDVHDVCEALDGLGIPWTGDPESKIRSRCPVHEGSEGSFGAEVNPETGKLLIHCSAWCSFDDMIDALGLRYQKGKRPKDRTPAVSRAARGPVYLVQPGRRSHWRDNADVVSATLPGAEVVQVLGRDLGALGGQLRGRPVWLVSNNTPIGHLWRQAALSALSDKTGALYDVILPHETPSALHGEHGDEGFRAALQDAIQHAALRGPIGRGPRAPLTGGPKAGRPGRGGGRGKDPLTASRRKRRALSAIRKAGGAGMTKRAVWDAVGHRASSDEVNAVLTELEAEGLIHRHELMPTGGKRGRPGIAVFAVTPSGCADPSCRRLFFLTQQMRSKFRKAAAQRNRIEPDPAPDPPAPLTGDVLVIGGKTAGQSIFVRSKFEGVSEPSKTDSPKPVAGLGCSRCPGPVAYSRCIHRTLPEAAA